MVASKSPPVLYTVEEVAAMVPDGTVSTVRHWMATGKLRSIRPGRRRLVTRKALAEFLGVEPSELAPL